MMTEDGEFLPCQIDLAIRDSVDDKPTVTVTFRVDGKSIILESTNGA
jgi:hypothetical protein